MTWKFGLNPKKSMLLFTAGVFLGLALVGAASMFLLKALEPLPNLVAHIPSGTWNGTFNLWGCQLRTRQPPPP